MLDYSNCHEYKPRVLTSDASFMALIDVDSLTNCSKTAFISSVAGQRYIQAIIFYEAGDGSSLGELAAISRRNATVPIKVSLPIGVFLKQQMNLIYSKVNSLNETPSAATPPLTCYSQLISSQSASNTSTFSDPFSVRTFLIFNSERLDNMALWKMSLIAIGTIISFILPTLLFLHYRQRAMRHRAMQQQQQQNAASTIRKLTHEQISKLPVIVYRKSQERHAADELIGQQTTNLAKKPSRENLLPSDQPTTATDAISGHEDASLPRNSANITAEQRQLSNELQEMIEVDHTTTCIICLEPYEDGEKLRELPCRHHFHLNCVDTWLINRNGTCPMCRMNCVSETEDSVAAPTDLA